MRVLELVDADISFLNNAKVDGYWINTLRLNKCHGKLTSVPKIYILDLTDTDVSEIAMNLDIKELFITGRLTDELFKFWHDHVGHNLQEVHIDSPDVPMCDTIIAELLSRFDIRRILIPNAGIVINKLAKEKDITLLNRHPIRYKNPIYYSTPPSDLRSSNFMMSLPGISGNTVDYM
jgi:hypothetical protein